jgi:hypothetical protein
MRSRAAHYHAAATAFGRLPTGAGRADLIRLHRDHCWRASRGDAVWHLRQAARLRRLIPAA